MSYTVKQLSTLAGVSVRTLHYYDEIDLLKPSWVGENEYRHYEEEAVFRLQQILFFRELDLSLKEIKEIIDEPAFDLLAMLQTHQDGLEAKIRRLQGLVKTINSTILYLTGETEMSEKQLFAGFNAEEEKRHERQAREEWGDEEVGASYKRWNNYTPQQKEQIKAEGQTIYLALASMTELDPASPEVQQVVARWHQHLRHFYEPTTDRLRGLGQHYVDQPEFAQNFRELHPSLPEFMRAAIDFYCQQLD